MKTPREILLQRHRAAESKLDAIRRHVLRPTERTPIGERLLRELLLPLRWHLAGMTAAWLIIAFLNTEPAPSSTIVATDGGSSPRQLLLVLAENRRQLVEMIELSAAELSPESQPFVPRRRSEAQHVFVVV